MEFFFFFFLEIVVYLPLSILSFALLYQAIKRKTTFQIIIFTVCFLFTGYRIVSQIPSYISFIKEDRQIHKYEHMKIGESATMEGFISFRKSFSYELQDSLFNRSTQPRSTSDVEENYIYLSVNTFKDNMSLFPINMSQEMFGSIKKYLNYEQQSRDTISYKLTTKIKKASQDRWVVYELLKIDSVQKLPLIMD